MLDKSFVYYALAEADRICFLSKSGPSIFNFLDFPLLVCSCPNSSCDFSNQELQTKSCKSSVNFASFYNI